MQELTQTYLAELLNDAAEAHHAYEQNTLGGTRDEKWAHWYAGYILDRLAGIPEEKGGNT